MACLAAKSPAALSTSCLETPSVLINSSITSGSDLRKIGVGLGGFEIGFGLNELLIDFRSIDVGEKFALADAAADVAIPLFEIAVGARVDRRFDVGLHGAGKDQIPRPEASVVGWMTATVGMASVLRFLGERLVLRAALQQRERAEDDQHNDREEENAEEPAFA